MFLDYQNFACLFGTKSTNINTMAESGRQFTPTFCMKRVHRFTENHLTHYTDYSKVFTVIAKSSCTLYTNVMCAKCQKKFHEHSTSKGGIKF